MCRERKPQLQTVAEHINAVINDLKYLLKGLKVF